MQAVTFPHLGPVYLTAGTVFRELGIPFVIPPVNNETTLEKGTKVSPEEMCLPFKLMAGNFIQAYEKGADTAIMPATAGPCRLGEYGELLKCILDKAGYRYKWILLDNPGTIGREKFVGRLGEIIKDKTISNGAGVRVGIEAYRLVRELDNLMRYSRNINGILKKPEENLAAVRGLCIELLNKKSVSEGRRAVRSCYRQLDMLERKVDKEYITVILTGEIYTLIEPFANRNLEEKLMRMGCSVKRRVDISWWMKKSLSLILEKYIPFVSEVKSRGKHTMPFEIGGYARDSVSEIESCFKKGGDGVIKIMPSGCMPEIVAKAQGQKVSREKNIPMLDLVFDEISGQGGYETRIEAFVDMLERSKTCIS